MEKGFFDLVRRCDLFSVCGFLLGDFFLCFFCKIFLLVEFVLDIFLVVRNDFLKLFVIEILNVNKEREIF